MKRCCAVSTSTGAHKTYGKAEVSKKKRLTLSGMDLSWGLATLSVFLVQGLAASPEAQRQADSMLP